MDGWEWGWLEQSGLKIKTWWIVGLPGGDYAEQLKSLELIEESKPNEVAIHTFVPLPGSEFWHKATKYGIHLPSIEHVEDYFYYSDPEDVKLDYLTSSQKKQLILTYTESLENMGYIPTDQIDSEGEYTYTSPYQKTTFKV